MGANAAGLLLFPLPKYIALEKKYWREERRKQLAKCVKYRKLGFLPIFFSRVFFFFGQGQALSSCTHILKKFFLDGKFRFVPTANLAE